MPGLPDSTAPDSAAYDSCVMLVLYSSSALKLGMPSVSAPGMYTNLSGWGGVAVSCLMLVEVAPAGNGVAGLCGQVCLGEVQWGGVEPRGACRAWMVVAVDVIGRHAGAHMSQHCVILPGSESRCCSMH